MLKKYKPFLTFIAVFLLSLYPIADTDFGWHLAAGQYIFQNKFVPQTDLFSFSLPDFPYVYYSWAGELLLFISQKFMGFYGPSIFFAFVLTVSIYFIYKSSRLLIDKHHWLLFLVATPVAHILAGGRMRVFGLLFFSIVYYLLTKYLHSKQSIFLILVPPVFLLWSNFHASFILGVGVLILLLFFKFSYPLLTTFIFSTIAIFANPYFYRIWQQAFTITSNEVNKLKTINPDWQSPLAYGLGGYVYVLVSIALLFFMTKNKVPIFVKVLNFVIFLLSLVTQRFFFALLVVFLPVANRMILNFMKKFKRPASTLIVKLSLFCLYIILTLLVVQNIVKTIYAHSNFDNYTNYLATLSPNKNLYTNWSSPAISFLLENFPTKNILSDANWGGLLLFRDKNLKLFYYGAMDNFSADGQLFPFVYLSLINAKGDWQKALDEYKVEVIYLPNNYPLIASLKGNENWRAAYQDEKVSIFLKN